MNYDIVNTNENYSYSLLEKNLGAITRLYPFVNSKVIGYSVLGKKIYSLKLGTGKKEVFYSASIHANEWITSILLMKFVENYCKAYVNKSKLYGYDVTYLFNNVSIYIVPMVNPDGVDLVTNNISKSSQAYTNATNISKKYPDIAFPTDWKANINGVDLNLQFPAGWATAKQIKYSQGFTRSCSS